MSPTSTPGLIMLLCSERSGSNLLTRLFDAHPEVCGPAPTHLGSEMLGNLHRYPDWAGRDRRDFVTDFLDLFEAKLGEWRFRPDRAWLEGQLDDGGPLGAYVALYREEARVNGKSLVFIKENQVYRWGALLLASGASTRWPYLVRDPRDMALSWKKAPALRGGVLRAAETWRTDQEGTLAFAATIAATTGVDIPMLHYEALVDDPAGELARLCEALDLPYHPDMLRYHESETSRRQASTVGEWSNLSRPPLRGNHGKYREALEAREIRCIENLCGAAMEAVGYSREAPVLDAEALEALVEELEPGEPWDKPAYLDRPLEERDLRQRQNEIFTRIRNRAMGLARAGGQSWPAED